MPKIEIYNKRVHREVVGDSKAFRRGNSNFVSPDLETNSKQRTTRQRKINFLNIYVGPDLEATPCLVMYQ